MFTLYASVKNNLSRNKMIRLLAAVVAGTKSAGFTYIKKEDADKLFAADNTLVTLDATGTLNAKGEIAVAATTAGVTASESNGPVEATVRTITAAQPFELETGVPVPEYRRGATGSTYPVDKLELGQALFVADAAGVDAHKVLASVAATANRKYKDATPRRFFSVRGKQTKGTGADAKTGARIWRVEPPVAAVSAAPATPVAPVVPPVTA